VLRHLKQPRPHLHTLLPARDRPDEVAHHQRDEKHAGQDSEPVHLVDITHNGANRRLPAALDKEFSQRCAVASPSNLLPVEKCGWLTSSAHQNCTYPPRSVSEWCQVASIRI